MTDYTTQINLLLETPITWDVMDAPMMLNPYLNFNSVASSVSSALSYLEDYLAEYSQIVDYRLRSTKLYLEGTKIPAFMGELTIRVNAPLPILQLVEVLLRSAVYTGVGVKTSLGMGKIQIKKE